MSKPTRRERRALRKQRIRERPTPVGRHPKTTVFVVVMILLSPLWASLGQAATNPALGPTPGSRLTEWVRDHGGGGIVTWAENTWYTWHAPAKGGRPAAGAIPKPSASTSPTTRPVATGPAHLPAPAAIVPFVSTPTPGEGQWHPSGAASTGCRRCTPPICVRTPSTPAWSPGWRGWTRSSSSAQLYAGTTIPGTGQAFSAMAPIAAAASTTLDAAFNSGFRTQDAQGGFYLDGITAVPLGRVPPRSVIDSSGNINIGAWGTDVTMTPSTVAVRQNLDLIVDNGAPVAGLNQNDNYRWGATLGGKVQVWRSGIGVTASGALVYVGGSGLSIVDLANVLARAGAVRAMELDINTAWVNFTHFDLAPGAGDGRQRRAPHLRRGRLAQPVLLPAVA